MNDNSLTIDPRIIPLVRSLKDKPIKSNKILNKIAEDLSSEKTDENTPKKTKSLNKIRNSKSNKKHNTTIKNNTKISIDAEAEPKNKVGTAEKKNKEINYNNKIRIVSKSKEPAHTPTSNIYQLNS